MLQLVLKLLLKFHILASQIYFPRIPSPRVAQLSAGSVDMDICPSDFRFRPKVMIRRFLGHLIYTMCLASFADTKGFGITILQVERMPMPILRNVRKLSENNKQSQTLHGTAHRTAAPLTPLAPPLAVSRQSVWQSHESCLRVDMFQSLDDHVPSWRSQHFSLEVCVFRELFSVFWWIFRILLLLRFCFCCFFAFVAFMLVLFCFCCFCCFSAFAAFLLLLLFCFLCFCLYTLCFCCFFCFGSCSPFSSCFCFSICVLSNLWIWSAAGGGAAPPPNPRPTPRHLHFISDTRACHEINILR